MAYSTYFVLNGLVNGERGVAAILLGGVDPTDVQSDGWYFLMEGEHDGLGPHRSRDEAVEAAELYIESAPQTWIFTGQLGSYHRADGPDDLGGDAATIQLVRTGVYSCALEGSYETLILTVSAESHSQAAKVFDAALYAMEF